MLHTLLRLDRDTKFSQPWFRALEVWSEIDEILESDTFGAYNPLNPLYGPIVEVSLVPDVSVTLQMAITVQSLNTRFTSCSFLLFIKSRPLTRFHMPMNNRDSFPRHHISTRRS